MLLLALGNIFQSFFFAVGIVALVLQFLGVWKPKPLKNPRSRGDITTPWVKKLCQLAGLVLCAYGIISSMNFWNVPYEAGKMHLCVVIGRRYSHDDICDFVPLLTYLQALAIWVLVIVVWVYYLRQKRVNPPTE